MISEEQWGEALDYEERIARILAVRNPPEKRPWWKSAHFIPSFVAVLTVAISSCATFLVQRELNNRSYRFQRDKASLDYSRQTIREVNNLVSGILKMNEERLRAATGYFKNISKAQRRAITEGTNRIQQEWRRERENAELLLLLDLDERPGQEKLWTKVRGALEVYTDCAEKTYEQYQNAFAPKDACEAQKQSAMRWRDSLHSAFYARYTNYWRNLGAAQ